MSWITKQKRTLMLVFMLLTVLFIFLYVAFRSGPLAPVEVTAHAVTAYRLQPELFGIGTVEARYSFQVGPTTAGRIGKLTAQVGDLVAKGELLGEMDPVDLDDRIKAQQAAIRRAEAIITDAASKYDYARTQARRYVELLPLKATTEEVTELKQQELKSAAAAYTSAKEEKKRLLSEYQGLLAQRNNLQLLAPVAGLVVQRQQEPGTTVVAGQGVIELIDPTSIWVNTRFDQISANGLMKGLSAQVELRSQRGNLLSGKVVRVEPKADSITEELLAKVQFDSNGERLPPMGELAEVTIQLPQVNADLVVPNSALHRHTNQVGVWRINDNSVEFVPVTTGAVDLQGHVQLLSGVKKGDLVIRHSAKQLNSKSRIRLVKQLKVAAR